MARVSGPGLNWPLTSDGPSRVEKNQMVSDGELIRESGHDALVLTD